MLATKAIRFFESSILKAKTHATRERTKNTTRFKCVMMIVAIATVTTTWIQIWNELNWKETNQLHHKQRAHSKKRLFVQIDRTDYSELSLFPFSFAPNLISSLHLSVWECLQLMLPVPYTKEWSLFSLALEIVLLWVWCTLLLLLLFVHRLLLCSLFSRLLVLIGVL